MRALILAAALVIAGIVLAVHMASHPPATVPAPSWPASTSAPAVITP